MSIQWRIEEKILGWLSQECLDRIEIQAEREIYTAVPNRVKSQVLLGAGQVWRQMWENIHA